MRKFFKFFFSMPKKTPHTAFKHGLCGSYVTNGFIYVNFVQPYIYKDIKNSYKNNHAM